MATLQCFLKAQDGTFVAQQASRTWWILLQEVDVSADQVEISIPKTVVDERTQFTATVNVRTRATALPATPTTLEYKIYNLQTREIVKDWTSLSASSQVTFVVSGVDNKIRDYTHVRERVEILVSADRGLSTEAVGRVQYKIVNHKGHE